MGKIYKGWELMKKIADGEIKKNQNIRIKFKDNSGEIFVFDGTEIIDITHKNIFDIYGTLTVLKSDIELIQDEIDIDSIEELEGIVEYSTERNTINQLIQAVKQLNKEVKEIKKI